MPCRHGQSFYAILTAAFLSLAPITSIADVDRKGVRIAVSARSAYDLWLVNNIKNATLVQVSGLDAAYEKFMSDKLEVLAGLRPGLLKDVEKAPGLKILDGKFTAVQQAITAETGITTELSTTGGTSDGRFIAQICPQVIELGPPNASIHKIDEHVVVADIEPLKNIYRRTLENLHAQALAATAVPA